MFRKFPKLFFAALLLLGASTALGQKPRDAAAGKKIDEAINEHYLATDFQKAEDVLLGTIKACEDKCSNAVLARAWMYVGLVRAGGKNDTAGAKDAFQKAAELDPKVKLDEELANAATRQLWSDVVRSGGSAGGSGGGSSSPGGSGGGGPKKPPKGEDEVGAMNCTPTFREIQTRYPLQIHCETEEDATKAELRYKKVNGDDWKSIAMKRKGDGFQAEIPCEDIQEVGSLRLFVRAKDSSGDTVDSWGSRSKPITFTVTNEEQDEVASFPDKDPPNRCKEKEECPPDLPGCGARGNKKWGDSCGATSECEAGLACVNGQCEQGAPCETDAECGEGESCVDGTCSSGSGSGGPAKKLWFGAHFAQDLAFISGDAVCSAAAQRDEGFACFRSDDTQYTGVPRKGAANSISGGVAPGTSRLLLSGGYTFGNILAGLRLGYAFGGGPEAGGTAFLPIHAELRGEYWIGDGVFSKKGFRPFVSLGGGVAQVDASLPVSVVTCPDENSPCVNAAPNDPNGSFEKLTVYKKLGQSFAAVGGGAMYALSPKGGFQLSLNIMYMLPTTGVVLEPSLGYVMGF